MNTAVMLERIRDWQMSDSIYKIIDPCLRQAGYRSLRSLQDDTIIIDKILLFLYTGIYKNMKLKKKTVYVKGMHCPSCDILVKDSLGECANISAVKADYKTQKVEITYSGNLNDSDLNKKISSYGYSVADKAAISSEPLVKRLFDSGSIAVILFIVYYFAKELNFLPENIVQFTPTSYGAVFILGLVASTSTCMATSGALFMSTIGDSSPKSQVRSKKPFIESIFPAISFNVGRVISYGIFGYIVGMLGKSLASNASFSSALTVFVAIFMVLIGLDMAGIVKFSMFSFTKNLFEPLKNRFIKNPKQTAFLLGAITYLLPCGFTQTVQLYALGLANPVQSALTMMVFALGTVPALLAIGFASSFTSSKYYPVFTRVLGVIIIMIGLSSVMNMLYLYGITSKFLPSQISSVDKNVVIENGVQLAYMSVNSRGYSPASFTVQKGIPVKWVIEGQNVFGCQGSLVAPKIAVQRTLEKGKNVIEFTPKETGRIAFSCSMGMFQGEFNVVEG